MSPGLRHVTKMDGVGMLMPTGPDEPHRQVAAGDTKGDTSYIQSRTERGTYVQ